MRTRQYIDNRKSKVCTVHNTNFSCERTKNKTSVPYRVLCSTNAHRTLREKRRKEKRKIHCECGVYVPYDFIVFMHQSV